MYVHNLNFGEREKIVKLIYMCRAHVYANICNNTVPPIYANVDKVFDEWYFSEISQIFEGNPYYIYILIIRYLLLYYSTCVRI